MEKKNSFKFYVSWNDALDKMDEPRVRRFLKNLCNHCEGKDIQLVDVLDEVFWSQVEPLLNYNEGLRQKRIANGKKGGLASSSKPKQTVANQARLSVEEEDVVEDDVEVEDVVEVEEEVVVEDDVEVEDVVEVEEEVVVVEEVEEEVVVEVDKKKMNRGRSMFEVLNNK